MISWARHGEVWRARNRGVRRTGDRGVRRGASRYAGEYRTIWLGSRGTSRAGRFGKRLVTCRWNRTCDPL